MRGKLNVLFFLLRGLYASLTMSRSLSVSLGWKGGLLYVDDFLMIICWDCGKKTFAEIV